jgi:uncharacterized protein YndB with AHSA1/START domain
VIGQLHQVQYRPDGNRWTLVFVRELAHPPERVWEALTDPDQLGQWAPFEADRNLATPGPATLTMIDRDVREPMESEVTRAERPSLLEYTWGDDDLRWELAPEGEGTRLTLRHTTTNEDFGAKLAAGWHLCLDVAEHLLDGEPIGPIRGRDAMDHGWQELADAYEERLKGSEG